jgi:hypothetical protein
MWLSAPPVLSEMRREVKKDFHDKWANGKLAIWNL